MSDASERFLDRLTRAFLPNHELATHARSEVEARLKPDQDKALEAAAIRLETVDASKLKPSWTKWAMLGLVLVILAVLGLESLRFSSLKRQLPGFSEPTEDTGRWMAKHFKHLSENERLLLFGDVSKTSPSDRIKALWGSEPVNPALFEDYAIAYLNDHGKLPLEFLETAEKLDPENGWFHLLAAAVMSKDTVKKESQTKLEKEQRQPPRWTILDQTRMREALSLFEKGCSKGRIQSYDTELLKRRFAILPQPADFRDLVLNIAYTASRSNHSSQLLNLSKAVSAQAGILAERQDAESFRTMLRNWVTFTRSRLNSSPSSSIEALVIKASIYQTNSNFLQAAKDLGLGEEARLLKEVEQRIEKEIAERKIRMNLASDESIKLHGGFLQYKAIGSLIGLAANPPEITPADLASNRRADHAIFAFVLSAVMAVLLLLFAGFLSAFPYRHGELRRKLARRHFSIFDHRDWVVLLCGGVLLPALYFGIIRYFTPLGGLGWSLQATARTVILAQSSLLPLLVISTSVLVVQSRVTRKMSFYKGLRGVSKVGFVLTVIGYLALPLLGLSTSQPLLKSVMFGGEIVIDLLLLWLLTLVIRGLFGRAHHALERQVVARLLVPIFLFAALVNCVAMPLLHLEESHWVKQDRFFRPDPAKPAMSAFEAQVAEQIKAELMEMISPLESLER